jgi:hypothetical protein
LGSLGLKWFLRLPEAEVAAVEPDPRRRVPGRGFRRRRPGQGLDQHAVREPQGGPGRFGRQADGQRVAPGVRGDHLGQLPAQFAPADRIGKPSADRDRGGQAVGHAHRRYRTGPQQPVPAQQVSGGRDVGPGRQLTAGGRGRPAAREPGRRHVEHGGAQDGHPRAARVTQQQTVTHVQRERLAQRQPGDRGAAALRERPEQPQPG